MVKYRSSITTNGRNHSGSRALWRATGMTDEDFQKPIIAVVNSFTEFVPGHIHLQKIGKLISKEIKRFGGVPKEFNTIAIDDGIAMGHNGMLYSLPSREIIADSIEYMINAHCADAMICISNCDKITPAMLMASMRLNIPSVFVSGGPMESGKINLINKKVNINLIDAITQGANPLINDIDIKKIEYEACPTCGSCAGLFTANSMNCLAESLGLAYPGNGSLLATHIDRKKLFLQSSQCIVNITKKFYHHNDYSVLPRNIANKKSFENSISLDIAMGGSTNTILHLLAIANEGKINFHISDIDRLSKIIPHLCLLAPSTNKYHMEDLHRAGGVMGILGELDRAGFLDINTHNILGLTLRETLDQYDIMLTKNPKIKKMFRAGPGGRHTLEACSQNFRWDNLDQNRKNGCIRTYNYAYSKYGGLSILYGNIAKNGCVVKTASVDKNMLIFTGIAKVFESQEMAVSAIIAGKIVSGDVIVIRFEGPKGGPGMQEMLYPTSYLKSFGLDKHCALITDGRFSGGTSGLSIGHISPEAANQGSIALIKNGDTIKINIPQRSIELIISQNELNLRHQQEKNRGKLSYTPYHRKRNISVALKTYAYFITSADKGAIRDIKKFTNN